MEKDKKVTALYCRLSKDDGSNSESLSIRTQKAMLMEYATRNGFGNCQYYVDDGYSGTNSDRPAFQELLDDIREGKVATVITKDQSRLGRNHIETGTYMEIFFPEHGVRYIAINDGYDSNEQSQMDIAPFRNIINEMYAKDTSRKIKSALRTRKKSGKYISSGAPFGYQKDPADHNHLVIDPNTAPVVEYIYSMAEEGLGLHRIAKRLHDEKVLKPCYYKKEMFGRFIDDEKMYDWDSAYISQVLHSPVYAGHIIYEAKPTVSMKSKKRRYIPFEERFHCLAHILGHELAVRSGICHQFFFIQLLCRLQGLAGGQAVIAVCFSLQGRQVIQLRGLLLLPFAFNAANHSTLSIASCLHGIGILLLCHLFRYRYDTRAGQFHFIIGLLYKVLDFSLPLRQHRQCWSLHTANGLLSAVLFRKSAGSVHADQPVRFCSALGRCKQIVIGRTIFQVLKALLDGGILHAADPQPLDGEFASGKSIHTAENRFTLASCVCRIVLGGDFSDVVTRWHPMGR